MSKALITGITGQIGSYMAEYLIEKGYQVDGLNRRKSIDNFDNLWGCINKVNMIEGDIVDSYSIHSIIKNGQYDEVYNLCAQSHVGTSFEQPVLTHEVNTIGVLNILEAIRSHSKHTKMYQASTSEMFGDSLPPQRESTPFKPCSPYGCAKLASHHLVNVYRDSYNLKLACGIMFNSESPRRGINFLPRKVVRGVLAYHDWCSCPTPETLPVLELGNIDARRDWSHAKDSVDAIYRICNQDVLMGDTYKDYVFGSGHSHSVRDFLILTLIHVFAPTNLSDRFEFIGEGINEILVDKSLDCVIMKINPKFYRPKEVNYLLSDPSTIKKELGWNPKYDLAALIKDMVDSEINVIS